MTVSDPLAPPDLSDLFEGMSLKKGEHVAVAVSGGADSLALTILLGEWGRAQGISVTALTVDHGLRPEARDEAVQVAAWLNCYDIPHVTLTWQGDKPHNNIQDRARQMRYQLMGDWCLQTGVKKLFLAHHKGDQAETFLMRLLRGSGVEGLAAMSRLAPFPGISYAAEGLLLCRPLLSVDKESLQSILRARQQPWIEDPSNQNDSYTRVKIRNLLRDNDLEGLTVERMAQTAQRMGRVQSLVHSLTDELGRETVTFYPAGYGIVHLDLLLSAHDEIALRLLARVLRDISGAAYAPRFIKLEGLYARLATVGFKGQSIGGCVVTRKGPDKIMISREVAAIQESFEVQPQVPYVWDGRFRVLSRDKKGRVQRLDDDLWKKLCAAQPELKKIIMPKAVRHSLPCLLQEDGQIFLPHFVTGCGASAFRGDRLGDLIQGFDE